MQGWSTRGSGSVRADGSYGGYRAFEYTANPPGAFLLVAPVPPFAGAR